MYFEKKRPIENRLNRCHGGIKALDVAHLQNPFVPPRRFEKRIRLLEIQGHRLFDQDVQPVFEQPAAHLDVRDSRHRHAGCFGKFADFFEAAQRARLKFYSDGLRASRISIVNANKFSPLQLAIHSRMVAPKFPRSHDGGADFSRISPHGAHSFFIPPEALFGSAAMAGANA